MLGGIFHKRKKNQDLRTPSIHDLKKFRDTYAKYADIRQVETPSCFEKSIYKAISGQKDMHSVEYRQEDITDPQMIALAESLLEMPIISALDLRDNRITDDGAKALLEVLRQQIIAAKTPPSVDPSTRQPLHPTLPEYTRYVTQVNLKGNEISANVMEELSQYLDILRREDKRLEIRSALDRIDRNNVGRIDEEEFKAVLKLLTASTPTKKEIRAFMQQHTLSTDNAQNDINLENVLLAKCATSPPRKAASPPWEALVQERHAILGSGRKAIVMPPSLDSSSPTPPKPRPIHTLPSNGIASGNVSTFPNDNTPETSPLASKLSQEMPVAPLDVLNAPVTKPPPAPIPNYPEVLQSSQHTSNMLESKTSALSPDQAPAVLKASVVPTLPLTSLPQLTANPSPHSARSGSNTSNDDEGQRTPQLSRENGAVNSVATATYSLQRPKSMSESITVTSPAVGGSITPRQADDRARDNTAERKSVTLPVDETTPSALDSPTWQRDNFSFDDDEEASIAGFSVTREDLEKSSPSDADDNFTSAYSHGEATSFQQKARAPGSSSHKSNDNTSTSSSSRAASFPGDDASRGLSAAGNDCFGDVKRSQLGNTASTSRFDDYSSLNLGGAEDKNRSSTPVDKSDVPVDQPEEDGGGDVDNDHVDSVTIDVTKDGKERTIVKLTHPEFKSGLPLKDFPGVSFRNLLAILLPENGLSDLALFAECRFPFVIVLDLSRNKLTKLVDDALAPFPRLEVLDLAYNKLKSIMGLMKTFKLRALNVSHNAIRSANNVEHLAELEVLQLSANYIATVHALRLLSLNKILAHLNLDGNPVVETDERQRRKNIVHVRNLLPMLQSLGSVPFVGLKEKKKGVSCPTPVKSLFDSDLLPGGQSLWVSTACNLLQISHDADSTHNSSHSQQDDDEWEVRDEDSEDGRPREPLTREQQRLKDEMRSRASGFRSREKAIPSPPNMKTSVYCFGKPQPPPVKKKKKKPAPADPSVVKEQQRRASQLSAPKHPPVDTTLMRQEQKRKSRVDYQAHLTVGERQQLARVLAQRRPTAAPGATARSRSMLADSKRASAVVSEIIPEEPSDVEANPALPSPPRSSPLKDAMVFRIDPVDTPHLPQEVLSFRVDPHPVEVDAKSGTAIVSGVKEAGFLHDLAVTDFLSHAEEEFSTALTALNVLLSMSEKEQSDRNKLAGYRASLEALDILNEHESHKLFQKIQGHPDDELQTKCTEWFTRLGVVKKCMRQLLEKLDVHAPGSGVIRAFCRCLRSTELRGIVTATLEAPESPVDEPDKVDDSAHIFVGKERNSPKPATNEIPYEKSNQSAVPSSVTSRLFAETSRLVHDGHEDITLSNSDEPTHHNTNAIHNDMDLTAEDTDLDFLESNDSVFDDDKTGATEVEKMPTSTAFDANASEMQSYASLLDSVPDSTDITMDTQLNDTIASSVDFHNGEGFDDQWHANTAVVGDNGMELSNGLTEEEAVVDEVVHEDASESHQGDEDDIHERAVQEPTDDVKAMQFTPSHDNDDDWLTASTELTAESNEVDSFEQDMAAVSEDEADGGAAAELTEETQGYDRFTTDLAIEAERGEGSEAVYDDNYEIGEEAASNEVEEAGDYNADENDTEIVNEDTGDYYAGENSSEYYTDDNGAEVVNDNADDYDTEVAQEEAGDYNADGYGDEVANEENGTEEQYQLEGVEDADDEEAETFGEWEKGFDPNSNHYFWFNHVTGESSWTPPEGWPYEVDEPFSGEGYDGAAEAVEGEAEYQEDTEQQEYDEGAAAVQGYEEGGTATEEQEYEYTNEEGQEYEYNTTEEGQQYEEGVQQGQEYEEDVAQDQEYGEGEIDQQHYAEEVTVEDQPLDQEDTEHHSEGSDFEFDDSDLPSF